MKSRMIDGDTAMRPIVCDFLVAMGVPSIAFEPRFL
jgi:hypothetical protein